MIVFDPLINAIMDYISRNEPVTQKLLDRVRDTLRLLGYANKNLYSILGRQKAETFAGGSHENRSPANICPPGRQDQVMGVGCAFNEAVRLRVKDLDLEQHQVRAKADKIGFLFCRKVSSTT